MGDLIGWQTTEMDLWMTPSKTKRTYTASSAHGEKTMAYLTFPSMYMADAIIKRIGPSASEGRVCLDLPNPNTFPRQHCIKSKSRAFPGPHLWVSETRKPHRNPKNLTATVGGTYWLNHLERWSRELGIFLQSQSRQTAGSS